MKNKIVIVLVVVFVVLLGGATILYNNLKDSVDNKQLADTTEQEEVPEETTADTEEADSFAPDFAVYDSEGNEVHLSDFAGKPVIINFWATWCTYCVQEMPDFEAVYKKYGDDIHFMMINVTDGSRETVEGASAYIEEKGYTFPVYYDTIYSAAGQYTYGSLPITYFIDEEGKFVAYGQGALDAESLQTGIEMLSE